MAFCKKVLKLSALLVLISVLVCCGKPDTTSRAPQKINPLLFKTANELTGAIRRGEITSLDLLNRHIANIRINNGRINAVVAMAVTAARERAAKADRALAEGQSWGPLHGLPMTVKDVSKLPACRQPSRQLDRPNQVFRWVSRLSVTD